MPGHSGITYGFSVRDHDGGRTDDLVMRVPPPGVQHRHNLDVVRFAPVIEAARAAGVPVPRVRWCSTDEVWFGTPYLIVDRVTGAPLPDIFESGHTFPPRPSVDDLFTEAISALVRIHAIDTSDLLRTGWARPLTPAEDLAMWLPLLARSEHPGQVERSRRLGDRLLETAPAPSASTVVHGDFYSNNWMVEDGRLTGVLDWENATLNDPGWDLGWMAALYDPACWGPSRAPSMTWHPSPQDIWSCYERESGRSLVDPEWYQALMCYRLACITPAKVRLHRSGRRVDPVWEVFAEAVPHLLERAETIVARRR